MENLTQKKSRWKQKIFNRRFKRLASHDGRFELQVRSYTNTTDRYRQTIDLHTGELECNCPDATYRRRPCKHLSDGVALLERRGDIKPPQPGEQSCIHCGTTPAEYEAVDDTGCVVIGAICAACVAARMDDLSDVVEELAEVAR